MQILLYNKKYVLYITKNILLNIGYNLYQITIPVYSFIYSHSILFTGIVLFVEYGIYTLSFLAGPLTDESLDKRYLFFGSTILIGFSALFFAFLVFTGNLSEAAFIILIGIMAIGHDITWTTDWTVIPLVVQKDDIARATGFSSAIGNASSLVGLVLGGALIILSTATFSMLIYSILIFTSAFVTLFLPIALKEDANKELHGMSAGWRYTMKDRPELLKFAMVVSIFSYFSLLPVLSITVIFAINSGFYYSTMFSALYIGSITSGIIIGRYLPLGSVGKKFLVSIFLMGILLMVAMFTVLIPYLNVVIWILLGFFSSTYYTIYRIYLKITTPKDLIARTASNLYTFKGIFTTLGAITIPILFVIYGVRLVFIISGFATLIIVSIIFLLAPAIRDIAVSGEN